MATNLKKAEEQASKELTDILAELSTDTGGGFNTNVITILEKIRDDLKKVSTREKLDDLLLDINMNLGKVGKYKTEMNAGYISIYTAADCMVRAGKKARTLPGQLLYFEEDTRVAKGKLMSQYELDGMHLSAEPDKCFEALTEIRGLILRCTKLHAELYVMGQQYDEFCKNIKILKINIPIIPEDKSTPISTDFCSSLSQGFTSSNVGLVIGGIVGLVAGGVISGCLLKYLCCACLKAIGNALLMQGCTSCLIKCGGVLVLSGVAFSLCVVVGLIIGLVWENGSDRRKVFEKLHQFRTELDNMKPDLISLCQQLETAKEGLKTDLSNDPNGSMGILEFNIIMKAYKDYRISYEEARADPGNENESNEELRKQIRKFGSSCIKPVMDRFKNISKSEAWELMDAIHLMVIRE